MREWLKKMKDKVAALVIPPTDPWPSEPPSDLKPRVFEQPPRPVNPTTLRDYEVAPVKTGAIRGEWDLKSGTHPPAPAGDPPPPPPAAPPIPAMKAKKKSVPKKRGGK